MSDYTPYIPEIEDGFEKPDLVTQMLLQGTYGLVMHQIKDALDKFVHHGAEQTIAEFNYARHYEGEAPTYELVRDYLADLMDSYWSTQTAEDIAGDLGSDATKAHIELALYSILRASFAHLDHTISNHTTPHPLTFAEQD